MKKFIILLSLISPLISACPTCVGRIEHDSPAFFKDDFYQPNKHAAQKNVIQTTKNTLPDNAAKADAPTQNTQKTKE